MAGFGGVALFGVIFYASGIPRLQRDVLQVCMDDNDFDKRDILTPQQKVPFVGSYFVNEVPPEDNVRYQFSFCTPYPPRINANFSQPF